eukprot:TRINITY_DN28466_c0_g1_i1.p1 TRINITY_DN28466_c0_g1~~TRINITY_DN28466_c0_g1_i1.p1  ORF type:complete len:544 (-),score=131.12 TRINITY_DN28466_c0_g1_i1:95-1624(-)
MASARSALLRRFSRRCALQATPRCRRRVSAATVLMLCAAAFFSAQLLQTCWLLGRGSARRLRPPALAKGVSAALKAAVDGNNAAVETLTSAEESEVHANDGLTIQVEHVDPESEEELRWIEAGFAHSKRTLMAIASSIGVAMLGSKLMDQKDVKTWWQRREDDASAAVSHIEALVSKHAPRWHREGRFFGGAKVDENNEEAVEQAIEKTVDETQDKPTVQEARTEAVDSMASETLRFEAEKEKNLANVHVEEKVNAIEPREVVTEQEDVAAPAEISGSASASSSSTAPAPPAKAEKAPWPEAPGLDECNLCFGVEIPRQAAKAEVTGKAGVAAFMARPGGDILGTMGEAGWGVKTIDEEAGIYELSLPSVNYSIMSATVSIPSPRFRMSVRETAMADGSQEAVENRLEGDMVLINGKDLTTVEIGFPLFTTIKISAAGRSRVYFGYNGDDLFNSVDVDCGVTIPNIAGLKQIMEIFTKTYLTESALECSQALARAANNMKVDKSAMVEP